MGARHRDRRDARPSKRRQRLLPEPRRGAPPRGCGELEVARRGPRSRSRRRPACRSASARWPTKTVGARVRSSTSPRESFRSEPVTAMPRARKSRARLRMPAPPTPIRWTEVIPSSVGTGRVGMLPAGGSVGRHRAASTTSAASRSSASGVLHARARSPHAAASSVVVYEGEDTTGHPLRRQVDVRVELGRTARRRARARSRSDGRSVACGYGIRIDGIPQTRRSRRCVVAPARATTRSATA